MNNLQKINGLVQETIIPALAEDFNFQNAADAKKTLEVFQKMVLDISVEDIYFTEE
jgi:hypothetical protein